MRSLFKRITAGTLVLAMLNILPFPVPVYAAPGDELTGDITTEGSEPVGDIPEDTQTTGDEAEDVLSTGEVQEESQSGKKSDKNKADKDKSETDNSKKDETPDSETADTDSETADSETVGSETADSGPESDNSENTGTDYIKADDGSLLAGSWAALQNALNSAETDDELKIVLSGDIVSTDGTLPFTVASGRNIIIDMAGHVINRGLAGTDSITDGYVIRIMSGSRLQLTDSTDSPGMVTGGNNSDKGGGILCEDTAELTLDGGVTVKGNRAGYGGGIYLGKDCELYLGTCLIEDNDARINGGGIYGGNSHISFLGGKTRVRDNTKADDTGNDLFIPAGMEKLRFWTWSSRNEKTRKVVYSERLTKGTDIGITFEEFSKEISDGYGKSNPIEANVYFYCNDDDYIISSDRKKSEVTIERDPDKVRNSTQTTLEIFKNDKLKSKKEYNSFTDAFNDALASDGNPVVTLGGDYSSDSEIVVKKNKSVTIDLNGHYIKRTRNYETKRYGGVIRITENATLTIKDSHPKKIGYDGVKGGVITGGASSNYGGGITIQEDGHLIMEGGTIYDCVSDEDGGGVYVEAGSSNTSFTMTGGRIYNCRSLDSIDECYSGGIFFGEGRLDISNATIDNCYSEDDGGAIYCRRGDVHLDNVLFLGNHARERGGAIYIDYDIGKHKATTLYARGCSFIGNVAEEDGGAVCIRDNPQYNGSNVFNRCVFQQNEAGEDGGAIEVLDDGVVLSNVEITENTAGGYGGGVYVDSKYDINVKGVVVIKDNTCKEDSNCNDMALGSGLASAYIYSGGLQKGSWIGIGSTDSSSVRLSKKMSVYEMKYFHTNSGSIGAKEVKNIDVDMVITASIFSEGVMKHIILFGSAGIVAAVVMLVYGRIRRKSGYDIIKEGEIL